jgi:hypothetical protein
MCTTLNRFYSLDILSSRFRRVKHLLSYGVAHFGHTFPCNCRCHRKWHLHFIPHFYIVNELCLVSFFFLINWICLLETWTSSLILLLSPAGNIAKDSPAAKYLLSHGVQRADWNNYGARRGNWEVMVRGTFANTRLHNKVLLPLSLSHSIPGLMCMYLSFGEFNSTNIWIIIFAWLGFVLFSCGNKKIKFLPKPGPYTIHHPSGEVLSVYDAAARYIAEVKN